MPPNSQMVDHNTNLLNPPQKTTPEHKRVKCVLIGDGAVGKTSLVVSYTQNGYPTEYVPTAFDNYSVVVTVDNQPIRLNLCDTAGQDDFDSLRPLCYPNTDVFLLCFSVVSPTSFHNIMDKWLPEIKKHCPRTPVVLVGTQSDLRNDVKVIIELSRYNETPVSETEATELADRCGMLGYQECSALTQKNLKLVFDTAIVAALKIGNMIPFDRKKSIRKSKKGKNWDDNLDMSGVVLSNKSKQKQGTWKKFCCFL